MISPTAALRAYNNLGDLLDRRDRYDEAIDLLRSGARPRPQGRIPQARVAPDRRAHLVPAAHRAMGGGGCPGGGGARGASSSARSRRPTPSWRSQSAGGMPPRRDGSSRGCRSSRARRTSRIATSLLTLSATVLRAEGRNEEALAAGEEALASAEALGLGVSVNMKLALSEALESALALGRLDWSRACSSASTRFLPADGLRSCEGRLHGSGRDLPPRGARTTGSSSRSRPPALSSGSTASFSTSR